MIKENDKSIEVETYQRTTVHITFRLYDSVNVFISSLTVRGLKSKYFNTGIVQLQLT
jgi:hypothetical protein